MDSNLIATIEDQIEILSLRIEKLRKQFDYLDKVVRYPNLIIMSIEKHNWEKANTGWDSKRCRKSKCWYQKHAIWNQASTKGQGDWIQW